MPWNKCWCWQQGIGINHATHLATGQVLVDAYAHVMPTCTTYLLPTVSTSGRLPWVSFNEHQLQVAIYTACARLSDHRAGNPAGRAGIAARRKHRRSVICFFQEKHNMFVFLFSPGEAKNQWSSVVHQSFFGCPGSGYGDQR